jgi:hypothetical protein
MYIFPPEDGHKTETCSGYWINIQTSVALDGNPEPGHKYILQKLILLSFFNYIYGKDLRIAANSTLL